MTETFLELDPDEFPDHPLIAPLLFPVPGLAARDTNRNLTADTFPKALFELSKHLRRIKQEEYRSHTCSELYDECTRILAEFVSKSNRNHSGTVLDLMNEVQEMGKYAGLLYTCLENELPFQTTKRLAYSNVRNIWIRRFLKELLVTRARHWDLCVSKGTTVIDAQGFRYDDETSRNIKAATEAAQCLWDHSQNGSASIVAAALGFSGNRSLETCEQTVLAWFQSELDTTELDRMLRSWSLERRRKNEKALLSITSSSVVKSLRRLTDTYLLQVQYSKSSLSIAQLSKGLPYLLPSLTEYEDLGDLVAMLASAHSKAISLHWELLKTNALELRPREMALILWTVLDGVLRTIGALWDECSVYLSSTTDVTEFRELHQDYLDRVKEIFADGSMKRLCGSVERFCSILTTPEMISSLDRSRQREMMCTAAYKSFKDSAQFVIARNQFDTNHGKYFFFF